MGNRFAPYSSVRDFHKQLDSVGDFHKQLNRLMVPDQTVLDQRNQAMALLQSITSSPGLDAARLVGQQLDFIRGIQSQAMAWQGLLDPSRAWVARLDTLMADLHRPAPAWDYGITSTIATLQESGLFATSEALSARLLEPPRVYTDFVQATARRLERTGDAHTTAALHASLYLAEEQFRATSDGLGALLTPPTDDTAVPPPRALRLPLVQQHELLAADDLDGDEDEATLLHLSPAADLARRARRVTHLIADCNEAAKLAGQEEPFKPTTRFLVAATDLPWLAPTNRQVLGEFVDCLYFMLYEGAGTDRLRFLTEHGGVLDPADCEVIWAIKRLRNKWLRHDADHGDERATRKSWADLSAQFAWLGLEDAPRRRDEFRLVHRRLLEETETLLRNILARW